MIHSHGGHGGNGVHAGHCGRGSWRLSWWFVSMVMVITPPLLHPTKVLVVLRGGLRIGND